MDKLENIKMQNKHPDVDSAQTTVSLQSLILVDLHVHVHVHIVSPWARDW